MPHRLSILAAVLFSLGISTPLSASQRDPATNARGNNATELHVDSSPAAPAWHAKNSQRTCTRVCVKNASGSYSWKDRADTCNNDSEQCIVQGASSAVTPCQSDFDEFLTQRGICVPRKAR